MRDSPRFPGRLDEPVPQLRPATALLLVSWKNWPGELPPWFSPMGPKWPHCDRESSSRSAATRTCVSLTCGLTASSGTPATWLSSYYFSAALRREQAPPRWFPRCGPTWPHGDRESSARSAATRTCVSLTCGFTASSSTPANLLSSYDFSASLGRELRPQISLQETCCVAETALKGVVHLERSD